jgi:superfamily II DNA/RNA helicase
MSAQKQLRQLKQKPNIIVATPGRLWELFSEVRIQNDRINITSVVG